MYHTHKLFRECVCIKLKKGKETSNLPNIFSVWSWIDCSGVELQRCAKLRCNGVEILKNLEKSWKILKNVGTKVCWHALFALVC